MDLTDVSKTAIITLRSHVIESRKTGPILKDPMAEFVLDNFMRLVSGQARDRIFTLKLSGALTNHIAIRARKYDAIINDFISNTPNCTVINLGCGFDTRYWRLNKKECRYIEIDLPEVVKLKKEILGDRLCYDLIGCSVLDNAWINFVTKETDRNVLLVAEGLFMYLNKPDVKNLFKTISMSFQQSKIVLEVVTEKYTRGIMKKLVAMKMKRAFGLEAGSSYNFGIKNAAELESYGEGLRVINEWCYFEDPDTRPRILKYLGLSRKQWTVTAAIHGAGRRTN